MKYLPLRRFVLCHSLVALMYPAFCAMPAVAQTVPSKSPGTSATPEQSLQGNNVSSQSPSNKPNGDDTLEGNSPDPKAEQVVTGYLSSFEFAISLIISVLALIALVLEFFLLRSITRLRAEDILRVYGITLIIFATLFFVTAGFDINHIAPATGLLGTVAGYLLGKTRQKKEPDDHV